MQSRPHDNFPDSEPSAADPSELVDEQLVEGPSEVESGLEARLRKDKQHAMRQLAYGASHEINNPLANIASRAQMLGKRYPNDLQLQQQLAVIYQQAIRAHQMISDMMYYAHPPALELICTTLVELSEKVSTRFPDVSILLPAELKEAKLELDASRVVDSIGALIENALEASSPVDKIQVSFSRSDEQVEIVIDDQGSGISKELRDHLFDPFFSGREAGRGLGFGLPKARIVAQLHGGDLEYVPKPGPGSCFRFRFPAA